MVKERIDSSKLVENWLEEALRALCLQDGLALASSARPRVIGLMMVEEKRDVAPCESHHLFALVCKSHFAPIAPKLREQCSVIFN